MKRLTALVLCLSITGYVGAAPAPTGNNVVLDVQPVPAPVPALKYQLLPEVAEMNPGNAVPAYLKCFAEQNTFFFSKEANEERDRLLKCPLTDIKPGSLKGYGGIALRQADHAARLEYADWNILPQIHEHGYMLPIPEVQQVRVIAQALAVRGRGQLADRDYDGAVATLKTIFSLARHMGEHPTIISTLVGLAIGQIGLGLVEEFVQQPGAPNLYWALTGMPTPLVDLRKGASADRTITEAGFGWISDRSRVWTEADMPAVQQKLKEYAAMTEMPAEEQKLADQWLRGRATDADWLAAARKGLTDAAYPAEAVAKYPPLQVVFHHLMRKARVQLDEGMKWLPVPYYQSEAALIELGRAPDDIEERLARLIVSSLPKVKAAHARLEQRLDLLRVVEAIRLDAASNGGKLPASPSELSVPVPIDPISGKAFEYKLDGMTATLTGKPTPRNDGSTVRYQYEIRLRK
jgi:hypothetical protein